MVCILIKAAALWSEAGIVMSLKSVPTLHRPTPVQQCSSQHAQHWCSPLSFALNARTSRLYPESIASWEYSTAKWKHFESKPNFLFSGEGEERGDTFKFTEK